MPQKRAAYKEIRKSKKRHQKNIGITSEVKTLIRKFNLLLSEKKFDQAKDTLKKVTSKMGKAAAKGVIRKITASRKISRLSRNLHRACLSTKK
ncbi:MAG: 30S ribosomal protein S20 [Candidatus Omnitrophica bacterium]|nr:30S ribosomal protein S20 [Candidatus Omnitrophota bacterium]